jgi:hypothetical protein
VLTIIAMLIIHPTFVKADIFADLLGGTGFYSETQILDRGEVSNSAATTGAIIGTSSVIWVAPFLSQHNSSELVLFVLPSFGAGQLVQGRYLETGWIVTLTESVALGLLNYEYYSGGQDSEAALALFYLSARVFEIYDLWLGPAKHNISLNKLKYSAAPIGKNGVTLKVTYRF